jgi:hypothetical protein
MAAGKRRTEFGKHLLLAGANRKRETVSVACPDRVLAPREHGLNADLRKVMADRFEVKRDPLRVNVELHFVTLHLRRMRADPREVKRDVFGLGVELFEVGLHLFGVRRDPFRVSVDLFGVTLDPNGVMGQLIFAKLGQNGADYRA